MAAKKKPTLPKHVAVEGDDGTVTIHPVDPGDTRDIALVLLGAAGNPTEVRTISSPTGFIVPSAVAKKAGAVTPKE